MRLLESASDAARILVIDEVGSTNAELVRLAEDACEWPHLSVVATTSQTAGRGRLGRTWVAPPGEALAASLLLRPPARLSPSAFGWFPLIAGVAMADAVSSLLPEGEASVKWPNDVLVRGRKVSGILTELLANGAGLVIGAGLNLTIPADRLPTPTSTSLMLEGVRFDGDALADAALSTWLRGIRPLVEDLVRAGGDAESAGVRDRVVARCETIGRRVDVELPGGEHFSGTALDIDGSGRLLVDPDADAAIATVAAGDVTHLRYE